ncbi:hypothetical protein BRC93_04335 [Halobacteriales archaeon QS_5_70_15]|nr:MAG: hypothetical protein BRC93_04335 [Halobacteriales archaeon QS_5_70_15]
MFELENGTAEVRPKTAPDRNHCDTSGLSLSHAHGAGSNTIRDVEPLKIGFIALRDAPPSPFEDPGDRYEDANGRVRDPRRSFRSATEYLWRVYPGDVVTYLHTDAPTPGAARKLAIGPIREDMKTANNMLDNNPTDGMFPSSGFPFGGVINLDGRDRLTMVNEIRNNGFDVTVAILPGVATNNSGVADHYNYHGEDPGLAGRAYNRAEGVIERSQRGWFHLFLQ